jgi:hypothetical protein
MSKLWVLLACLCVTGCATDSHFAVYRHPATGDVLECEKPAAGGGADIYGIGDAPKIARYNECKDIVERRGYLRMGTVDRPPTAKTNAEQSTPRPAP